ncbi:MAG: hypothetical protein JXB34_03025, partial [Bacteroidales bacterium]|nr:hypothetical protein [Bacteroidales bacterium]
MFSICFCFPAKIVPISKQASVRILTSSKQLAEIYKERCFSAIAESQGLFPLSGVTKASPFEPLSHLFFQNR